MHGSTVKLSKQKKNQKFFYLAPMMKKTDRHFRYLARLISPNIRLFTEMLPAEMLVRDNRARALAFSESEKPLAIQLGGCKPNILAAAARHSALWGYDEVNLNCGCPSPQVIEGGFGAQLMKDTELAVSCVSAMRDACPERTIISVKVRLGVDELYSYDYFSDFVKKILKAGASRIHVHARKAVIKLNPKANRMVPPINYQWVYKLKQELPDICITINGEISSLGPTLEHLEYVDGIMIGRHAYARPLELIDFDRAISRRPFVPNKASGEILEEYLIYAKEQVDHGASSRKTLQPLLNLFHGFKNAKVWRRSLSEQMRQGTIDIKEVLLISNKVKII